MTLEVINKYVREGFAKAGLTTSQALRDDEKVRSAARTIYKQLPFAVRATLSVTLGKDSLEIHALKVRDLILKEMA